VLDLNALHSTLPLKAAAPAAPDPADPDSSNSDVEMVDALLAVLTEKQDSQELSPAREAQGTTSGANGRWDDIMDSDLGW